MISSQKEIFMCSCLFSCWSTLKSWTAEYKRPCCLVTYEESMLMNRGKWKVDLQSLQVEKRQSFCSYWDNISFTFAFGNFKCDLSFQETSDKVRERGSILLNICTMASSHNPFFIHKNKNTKGGCWWWNTCTCLAFYISSFAVFLS